MEGGGEYVDTSKAERAVWLMKCPAVVSRSFHSSSSVVTDVPVAKVIVSIDPLSSNTEETTQLDTTLKRREYKSKITDYRCNFCSCSKFTMELCGHDLGNVPKCFSMDMSKKIPPMSVFSESQGKISVEGRVQNRIDMRPHYDAIESYGKLCRERTDKYMTKSRQIQMIGNDRPMVPMPGITHVQEKRKVVVKGSETKRTRKDRGEMEDIMFKLFEQQSNWTLKELIQKTDQPEQFMKDILKDLCVYNNKGANQGSYELKPEYKRSVEDPSTA